MSDILNRWLPPGGLNAAAASRFDQLVDDADRLRCNSQIIKTASSDCQLLDLGVEVPGSLDAGIRFAELCMSGLSTVSTAFVDHPASNLMVQVQTDHPVAALLASQYAGWPVASDDGYFAMGSGPMRVRRGREPLLQKLGFDQIETDSHHTVGVLESDRLPTEACLEMVMNETASSTTGLQLAIAPVHSIAGTLQVVARSIETTMHKMFELGFDVRQVVSGYGAAPLPPPVKPGDTVNGIGRTNDAILYGGTVVLWINSSDDGIADIIDSIPSASSDDHGQPFAKVFKQYDYDFYKVDPHLFSPARVIIHALPSGRTFRSGNVMPEVLESSFLS